jgi:DeoR/GlpR family transcriptional regulator of sugar metabolism
MGELLIGQTKRRRSMAVSEVAEHLGFRIATIRR